MLGIIAFIGCIWLVIHTIKETAEDLSDPRVGGTIILIVIVGTLFGLFPIPMIILTMLIVGFFAACFIAIGISKVVEWYKCR